MKVNIKKLLENAVIPQYAKEHDAGLDLVATEINFNDEEFKVHIKFGIAIEIPEGHVGLLFPRSSIHKQNALLTNSVGVIDAGYRGEIQAFMFGNSKEFGYKVGDRVIQLIIMPYPKIEFEEVQELSSTDRGEGGFGSTNN